MPPRSTRNTKRVDYSKFADPDPQNNEDNDVEFDANENDPAHESEDFDMDDHDDIDVEDIEERDIEEESIEEDISGNKKARAKTKKTIKSSTSTPRPRHDAPKKDIRNAKNLTNIREKLFRIFGTNSEKMLEVVKLREDWEDYMFDFPDDKLQEYITPIIIKNVPKMKCISLTKAQFDKKLPLKRSINFSYNTNTVETLEAGNISSTDRGQVLNTGGLITDLAWLPHGSESLEQILAVAISDITDTTLAPEFSLLGNKSYRSGILIYSLDTQTLSLKLIKALVHEWGNCWDLQWKRHEGIGLLSAVFNDGKVRLLRIEHDDENDVDYSEITEPSFEYGLPDMKLSSYDWIDDTIICGTEKGYVASFALCDPIPSYAYPLHSGYIFSIKAAKSKYDEDMVYTSSSDGYSALFSTVDIRKSRNIPPRNRSVSKTVIYSPQLYSFIQLEGPYSTKLMPIRALFVVTPVTKHDGSTESMATSNVHPMLLSGGADGTIKLTNLARRVLNGQRHSLPAHKVVTLWELQYGKQEDRYRLVDSYEVETLNAQESVSTVNIYPSGVAINAVKWNENVNAGKWYAASSTSGLLIVGII